MYLLASMCFFRKKHGNHGNRHSLRNAKREKDRLARTQEEMESKRDMNPELKPQ